MKLVVLDAATLGEDLDLSPFAAFGDLTVRKSTSPEEMKTALSEAEIIVINKVKITKELLKDAPHLKLICIAATGYDNVDTVACREHHVAVCNVVGYSTDSVAQLTLAMALSLYCHLPVYQESVRNGSYQHGAFANILSPVYHEIAGKTWGIVGYGCIGKKVADCARAMGCRVIYHRLHPDGNDACVSLEQLLRESDIVSIHTPLNDSTRGLLSRQKVAMMKKDAVLINVARGAVLDEAAVADAVKQGMLGAFGCDVYSAEPFPDTHPYQAIVGLPNVCFTPHMAWGAYEARVRCRDEMAENIRAFLRGERRSRVD